jgi:zinc and cadmium transporter
MHPALLLGIYCLLSIVASLSGGWVPLVVRLTHRRMQFAISFVSGVMLGIGMLHLLPHSFEALHSIDRTVGWALAGFLFMFFLERFFHFHHHDVGESPLPDDAPAHHDHADHDHATGHHASHASHDAHEHARAGSLFPWGGAVVGLTLHGLIDGVAMAAAVQAEAGLAAWAGLGTFLAIVLHKPFDSLTIGTLMAADGRPPALRHLLNALYSLVTPLGVVLFFVAAQAVGEAHDGLGQVLGFAAGAFICIATSDLLPELQFHRHDRLTLSAALVAGIAVAWGTVLLEGGHDHSHSPTTVHEADHDHQHHD